jgi:aminopeptidase N
VVDALLQLGDTKARGPLRRALERELDGRVARRLREALRDIGEAGSAERKRLGDDVETLRGELRELKTRLAKLEVKRTTPDAKPVQKTRSRRSGRPKRGRRA